jgi:putative nucleotidyltransferase with HDIG domain
MAALVHIAAPDPLPTVLIVDDEAPVAEYVVDALLPCCAKVCAVSTVQEALFTLSKNSFDLILADVCMPGAGGLDLLALIRQLRWDCEVILMTGHAQLDQVVASVRLEASDFLLKPFSLNMLRDTIHQSHKKLNDRRCRRNERDQLNANLVERQNQLETTRHLLSDSRRMALESLILTLEAREQNTYAHSFRVRSYALHLASLVGYPAADIELLGHAALLHDIGKVAVSDQILLKDGPLNDREYEIMKAHCAVGERIVNRMGFLAGAGTIIRHHHERWDGRGYPDGLSGTHIPLASRLFAIADTLDAMTSNRCYRRALTLEAARAETARCAGTQFDPKIAAAFATVPPSYWEELRRHSDQQALAASTPGGHLEYASLPPEALVQFCPAIASR